ncbi:MAG: ribonuclease T2, partial [Dokdonella sp.]
AIAVAVVERGFRQNEATTTRAPKEQSTNDRIGTETGDFDYYLIALSWSPSYCDSNPDDREQCGTRGYGFVLHGLWPQYERGGGPRDCAGTSTPDRATVSRALAFMPSQRLIAHQWRAHGRCSGLDATSYFDAADRAFAQVRIPVVFTPPAAPPEMSAEAIASAFVEANPGLGRDMVAVVCRRRDLAEVRVCVDHDLAFRACARGVRTRCPRDVDLRVPASR